jgi:flagellar basal-body rod protein FlgF
MNSIYLAASGAASQLAELNTVSNNLANLDTPGYRRFVNVLESVQQSNGSPYQYASAGQTSQIDMAQGPLQDTGNPLDVAITGPAFLNVQAPDGSTAYTRNGQLQVGGDGTLLAAGHPVLSAGGGTIILQPGQLTVGADGSLSVASKPAGKLALSDPTGVTMVPGGESIYRTADGSALPPSTASQLHQGMLEHSTGTEMGEMVSMMDGMRNYESAMNTVHQIDSNQGQAIQAFTLQA